MKKQRCKYCIKLKDIRCLGLCQGCYMEYRRLDSSIKRMEYNLQIKRDKRNVFKGIIKR